MTLLEKMDRLVYATQIDRIIFASAPPRSLRWSPAIVLAVLATGFVVMTRAGTHRAIDTYLFGALLFYGAIIAATYLRAIGPRFTPGNKRPLDERELMVKARAHAASGTVFAVTLSLGCFYMASAAVPGLWHPQGMDWVNLGFGIQGLAALLPTWIASWIEPRPLADTDP